MLYVKDIKMVDLTHSKWDKTKSKPKEGEYIFEQEEHINYYDKARRPEWFLSWARYNPNSSPPYRDLLDWKVRLGYTEVNVDIDKWIWPKPLVPDENGHYVYGDLILVKRPLIDELKERVEAKEMSEKAAPAAKAEYDAAMRKQGADVPEQYFQEAFGERK